MFKKSRKVVALGLVAAVAVSGIAMATASENEPRVIGKVAPNKLPKKKFKPVDLTLGVANSNDWITGTQSNPLRELIRLSKNVKVDLSKAPRCNMDFENGTTIAFARSECPAKSYLGGGTGEVQAPTMGGPVVIAEPDIAVMNGPGKNKLQLIAESAVLGSPVIDGKIVPANKRGFGKALRVNAPETGGVLITKFQATLKKARGVVKARCKPRKIKFHRTVTYKDDTSETVMKTQRCKVRR